MTRHGGPDALEVRNVTAPTPGAGEVLVAVRAAGVNNTDIWTREGAYGLAGDPEAPAGWRHVPIATPRIQGADVCGVVEAVGPDGDAALVGRRVIIDPARYDGAGVDAQPDDILGSERDGGFAELVVAREAEVHDVTASPLDDTELAALPIAYGTAMGMLDRARAVPGERLVATGASGGVGLALVQLGAAIGLDVIAVSTEDKAELLLEQGARAVVDRRSPSIAEEVRRTAGGPVEVVADVVGGSLFSVWPTVLSRRGRIVVAGAIAGPVVRLDLRLLYLEQREIIGSTMHTRPQFERLAGLARAGSLSPVVARRFPLERIHDAQEALRAPETVGKIVIEPV